MQTLLRRIGRYGGSSRPLGAGAGRLLNRRRTVATPGRGSRASPDPGGARGPALGPQARGHPARGASPAPTGAGRPPRGAPDVVAGGGCLALVSGESPAVICRALLRN